MGVFRFSMRVGLLTRGQAKSMVMKYCWDAGLKCDVQEDKGLLESSYRFTIEGPNEAVIQAQNDIKRWVSRNWQSS